MKKIIRILFFVLLLSVQGIVVAEAKVKTPSTKVKSVETTVAKKSAEEAATADEFDFKKLSLKLAEIEEKIKNGDFTRRSLEESSNYLNETELKLENVIRKLEKDQNYAQEALAAFGENAEASGVEDKSIAEMKEKYTAAVASYKNKLITFWCYLLNHPYNSK